MTCFRLLLAGVLLSLGHAACSAAPEKDPLDGPEPVVEDGAGVLLLKQQKYNAALLEFQFRVAMWQKGKCSTDDLIRSAGRLHDSDLSGPITRVKIYLAVAERIERIVDAKVKAGVENRATRELARYHRLELQIEQMAMLEK